MTTLNATTHAAITVISDISQFTFNSVDYTVFSLMLAVSAGIGVYFGFFSKSEDTTEEYLHGGKQLKTLPIAISLVASQLSGISIMTIPSEMYYFGMNWFFNVVAVLVIIPILIWVVVPVFYNNNIVNCYEYLEMRFNRKTRELQTVAFMGTLFLMLPIFIFVPAIAFSQVFTLMLGVSAGIGVYFGFFAKSEDTTEEYLHGGKQLKTLPIAISLVASQLSGISIMTIPAEMYYFGMNWFFNVVAMIIIIPILNWVVVPVFYNNNIVNCYEYLEIRFNRKTRELQTVAFMGTLFLMLPVFIFVPAIAFAQVSGVNIHLINGIVCAICVFYTMFGGIKAVVWTDVVQAAIMVISVVLVGILGAISVGGFGEVFRIAQEGGRLTPDFTFDATTRATFWNCFTSSVVAMTAYVGLNQSCVQRLVSLPTLTHAKHSLLIFGAGFIIIKSFNCFAGFVMYARYHDCDPLTVGLVSKADKLMPFFVQDVVGHLKGMPGVFISCVFSASLSTMSAGMNSLAGVVYFDYIKPHIKHTERRANLIMKTFVFFTGMYCIAAGFAVERFASILQLGYSIAGVTFGSVFGVFLLGMLLPKAHGRAAFWAVVSSILAMVVIVAGAQAKSHYKPLATTTDACPGYNITTTPATSRVLQLSLQQEEKPFSVFDISFNWYVTVGAFIVFAVGIPLSFILSPEKGHKFDPKLLSPIVRPFVKYELTHVEEMTENGGLKEKC